MATAVTKFTRTDWARDLLGRLGAPVTPENEAAIVAWEMAEGGHFVNNATYNPLNTTLNEPGATSINSVGVKAYPDYETGMTATVKTLAGTGNGYEFILAALRQGNNAPNVLTAVVHSSWGTKSISNLTAARAEVAAGGGTFNTPDTGAANPEFIPGVPDAVPNPLGSLSDLVKYVGRAATWIADRHNWLRVIEIGLGIIGLFVALRMLTLDLAGGGVSSSPKLAEAVGEAAAAA